MLEQAAIGPQRWRGSVRVGRERDPRLALGHLEGFDDTVSTFAQQLGLTSVQFHTPSDLAGDNGYWERGRAGRPARAMRGGRAGRRGYRERPVPPLGQGPARTCPGARSSSRTTARRSATWPRAGIPCSATTSCPPTCGGPTCRRGAGAGPVVTAFDADASVAEGNALAGYKLAPDAAVRRSRSGASGCGTTTGSSWRPSSRSPRRSACAWRSIPTIPPTDLPLGGIARILASPEGLERARELSGGSPAWGLDLCLGTVSEMAGTESVEPRDRSLRTGRQDLLRPLPRRPGRGAAVPGIVPRRGQLRPARPCSDGSRGVGFDGFIIDDHVPAMIGDEDTWANTASAAYCSRGRAHAIGYLQGLLHRARGRGVMSATTWCGREESALVVGMQAALAKVRGGEHADRPNGRGSRRGAPTASPRCASCPRRACPAAR